MQKKKKKVIQAISFLVEKRSGGSRLILNFRRLNTFIQEYKLVIIVGNPSALEGELGRFFDHLLVEHVIPV